MLGFLPPVVRGVIAFLLLLINTLFWCSILLTLALVRLVLPFKAVRVRIGPVLNLDMRASPERLRMGAAERCHADMVAACKKRDGRAARAALEADISGTAKFIASRGILP